MTASPSPTRPRPRRCAGGLGVVPDRRFTVEQLRPGGNQSLAWLLFLSLTLAGVVGIILVARRHPAGAAMLALVALGTTLPLGWTRLLWYAGIALAAFFVMVLVL